MQPQRITIATAEEVAARLPFPSRREGPGRYRTRGVCHGSADKPDSASLIFNDPARPGEQSLHVHCFKCSPSTPAERDAIRHELQKATGLQLCKCPDCFAAARSGQPPTQRPAGAAGAHRRVGGHQAKDQPAPRYYQEGGASPHDRGAAKQWGAHQLPENDAGGRSHASPCPLCRQSNALITWTLADHPFPYMGLSLQCECGRTATYDQLHSHIAGQIAAKGQEWRQDAVYTLADGRKRARKRTDPGKDLRWAGPRNGPKVKGRLPLCWNRRGPSPDCPRVLLCEGEKAAAALISAGIDGSHAVYSVGDTAGFSISDFALYAGRSVVLWPDADGDDNKRAGIVAAAHAARILAPIVGRLSLVATDDLHHTADAADLTKQEIQIRIRQAKEIYP